MKSILKLVILFSIAAFSQTISSCSKKDATPQAVSPTKNTSLVDTPMKAYATCSYYDQSLNSEVSDFSILAVAGDTLQFSGQAVKFYNNDYHPTPAYKFVWHFGDGDSAIFSSTSPTMQNKVSHLYKDSGKYTIRLIVNDTIVVGSMLVAICSDPLYTYKLCVQKNWHEGKETVYQDDIFQKQNSLPDSSFAIVYHSKITISLWGQTYFFIPEASSGDHLVFGDYSPLYFNINTDSFLSNPKVSSIYFNTLTDSMSMSHVSNIYGPRGSSKTSYHVFYHSP
ncbi:MAG: hypothetical protein JWQ38_1942 [Flavipsychrobacter sp.]|nr:hypothetical protein [Flavipsychrobacter sp.]